jgi:hypothetical protein
MGGAVMIRLVERSRPIALVVVCGATLSGASILATPRAIVAGSDHVVVAAPASPPPVPSSVPVDEPAPSPPEPEPEPLPEPETRPVEALPPPAPPPTRPPVKVPPPPPPEPEPGLPEVEPYRGARGGHRTAIIGDSITFSSSGALHDRLDSRYRVSVDGRPYFTVGDQLPVAAVYAAHEPAPSLVVINLGTNDVNLSVPIERTQRDLAAMVSLFPDARCVVVVTVTTNTAEARFNQRADAINAVIENASADDARIRVADWSALVRRHEDEGWPEGGLTDDGIHPTEVGQRVLADLIHTTLATCSG